MAQTPVIALIGPPNVGKSTLFNTIAGKRLAITGPKPGTTRDRSYTKSKWDGREFILVDTGGLARKSGDPLEREIILQAELAIFEAQIIIFVVDGKQPVSSAQAVAREFKAVLRKNKNLKPRVFLAVNKVDSAKRIEEVKEEFTRLGFGQVFTTSALTGRGVGDILDEAVKELNTADETAEKSFFANVAIVGKPNVGKSTLLNQLAGKQRAIVSPIPGTTRASVDIEIDFQGKSLRFIDTAGMRRRARIDLDVEEYALFQSIKAIENSDVVVLLLDATQKPTRFELTIGGRLKSSVKGIVVAVNKIDLMEDKADISETEAAAKNVFPFLKFSRVVPLSAKNGLNIPQLLSAIVEAKNSRDNLIEQKRLTGVLRRVLRRNPPVKLRSQKKPVIYGLEQINVNPPVFNLIVNEPPTIHFSYIRHLENELRKAFGFTGTAIKIRLRKPRK